MFFCDPQELGPYIYESKHEKQVHGWQQKEEGGKDKYEDNFISFQRRTVYNKVQNAHLGRNDDEDIILIPNLILMSGMLKSEVQTLPAFLKESLVWNVLLSTGKKSPILRMSVSEFLWGYEVT